MRRELPPQASLEHLKKQAKDLLDAHGRAEPEALARIRQAVPAFAGLSDDAIAKAPFALHDAQSAIAREYGSKSWNDLREAVAAQGAQPSGLSEATLRALMPLPFPAEVGAILRDAPRLRPTAGEAAQTPLPESLPALAMRNALFVPGAVGPIHVARPSSRAALDAALARTPPTLAIFAQRRPEQEEVDAAALFPVGCECLVHKRVPDGEEREWVVLEGVRWATLVALETAPDGHLVARVSGVPREPGDAAVVSQLTESLRDKVRDLMRPFPDADRLLAIVDAADADRLANLVVANAPASVEDKARYAAEPDQVVRLRTAHAMADARK
jgi:Lon protease-like protein